MKKDSLKKERIFMVAASAFVLAAFTMTGVYMKNQEAKYRSDGYRLDASDEKDQNPAALAEDSILLGQNAMERGFVTEDDLDYTPIEEVSPVDSGNVKIPGLTEKVAEEKDTLSRAEKNETVSLQEKQALEEENQILTEEQVSAELPKEVHFDKKLLFPVYGEVLIPYSMDSSVYFKTLDQYKYNPGMVISAEKGASVSISAAGIVKDIQNDPQLGQVLVLDVGDGYEIIYGQLSDITYGVGSYVEAGTTIASVAAPTKYYSEEGSNLYFQVKRDGVPMDPKQFFGKE